ncbi:hypothetical protein [Streptomyces sp. A0958]|uniref:hypothetical protein n=1 Tax=Streptomyces sp. A0958 TaxID=2563101 RepID=UPI001447F00E|nr:hypothetical protein [Streptomyces sp. A0958]
MGPVGGGWSNGTGRTRTGLHRRSAGGGAESPADLAYRVFAVIAPALYAVVRDTP